MFSKSSGSLTQQIKSFLKSVSIMTRSPNYSSSLLVANGIANQFKNLLIPKIAFVVYRIAGLFHFFHP